MSLPEILVDQSGLTRRQLEALQSYMRVALGEMKYREAAASGTSKSVSVGSYYRLVQQARGHVRESVVTLLIGLWLGLVRAEDVRRLMEVAGVAVGDLSDEQSAKFAGVLQALLSKIVM